MNLERAGKKAESRFLGISLAAVHYEMRIENCSTLIEDTCSIRDCKLQVYKLNEDEIFIRCHEGVNENSIRSASLQKK